MIESLIGISELHSVRNRPFRSSRLFSQYRSCEDTQENMTWTFSCSHAVCLNEHDT